MSEIRPRPFLSVFLSCSCLVLGGLGCRGEILGSGSSPGGGDPDPGGPGSPGGGGPGGPGGGANPGGGGANPGGPGGNVTPVPPPPPSDDRVFFASAVRRLTKAELRQTLQDLLGVDLAAELAKFPEDYAEAGDVFAFDNKYEHQQPSSALIEAAKNLADVAGARVLADQAVQRRLVTCTPTAAGDAACLRSFVQGFGRRVMRRPLTAAEVDGYVSKFRPLGEAAGSFYRGVSLVVRAMLQDVEFLYRNEIGQPVQGIAGVYKLTGPEVATRLSYFLWGTSPDDPLLDAATGGDRLQSPQAIRAAAERMLADPRAVRGVNRFHGMWLGYERQPPPAPLGAAMNAETGALIERVIFKDRRPWLDLFRSKETYVDAALAAHYGLPAPAGGSGWVGYGATGRQGILSHGSFLGVERKHDDTSPTMRGQFIRTRLLCTVVPPPPPDLMVDVDAVPTDGECKADRYSMWKREGCKGCHMLMDPIGLGLENYDRVGRYRQSAPADAGKPACAISGRGELAGSAAGMFDGVAGLSDKLVASGQLEACLGTQLASHLLGRAPRGDEVALFQRVGARFAAGNHRFDLLLLDVVSLPGFGYRIAE
jgi:hypothetical protein